MDKAIHESSGNVFANLDSDAQEAAIPQMRAKLMADLREAVLASVLTQTEVAARLGIAQSRLSDLMRNKWDKFSLEMLITLEARGGG